MKTTTTSSDLHPLSLSELQNITGGNTTNPFTGTAIPVASTGYSTLLGNGSIVPNIGWLPSLK